MRKQKKKVDEPYLKFEHSTLCSAISTRHRHIHNVTSMKYVSELDQIAVFAEKSGAVKIYDADSAKVVSSFTLQRGAPMAVEYVPSKSSVMMSFGDTTMCLYDWNTYKTALAEDGTPLVWPCDESDDSFTLKQLFQRAIWNAMRNDKMDHLKTIADEAEKAGISSIAKLASTLYTQKTQYPL